MPLKMDLLPSLSLIGVNKQRKTSMELRNETQAATACEGKLSKCNTSYIYVALDILEL